MKISDEQYANIGKAVWDTTGTQTASVGALGRAAVEAVAPLLLAEPTVGENNKFASYGPMTAITRIMSDRLASVLAKPDPAIEAVREVVDRHFGTWCASVEQKRTDTVLAIVAAVDAARAPKP